MAKIDSAKCMTVAQMADKVRHSMATQAAAGSGAHVRRPEIMFSFLVGAGFSHGSGMFSTKELVSAMVMHEQEPARPFKEIFSQVKVAGFTHLPGDYYELMERVLVDKRARQKFITAAVQWAAAHKDPLCNEGRLLATLLTAGAGGMFPLWGRNSDPLLKQDRELFECFSRNVFTSNFDEVLPTTSYRRCWPVEIFDRPSRHTVHGNTDYPGIIYLHGRHLHYGLLNTPDERGRGSKREHRSKVT